MMNCVNKWVVKIASVIDDSDQCDHDHAQCPICLMRDYLNKVGFLFCVTTIRVVQGAG